ncbi:MULTISPECIES: hypothetical protein [Lysinibacillus]|uniref:hypothetical protein n=1 Tax=Lysinibacillus TaxID=400634 RepID=UPI000AEBCEFF|nr:MULTISPECIES: hypothetical protein [Lysinibacillus]
MNIRNHNSNFPTDSPEIYAAKLTYIGASISTLGDSLQAIAAGLALEVLKKYQTTIKQFEAFFKM